MSALESFHEWPEWCTLFWSSNYVSQSDTTYYVPTNFPTPKIRVYLDDTWVTNITITTPKNWNPGREVEVHILPVHQMSPTNRSTKVTCAGGPTVAEQYNAVGTYSDTCLHFYPDTGYWESRVELFRQFPFSFNQSGQRYNFLPNAGPETVEEWLALREAEKQGLE